MFDSFDLPVLFKGEEILFPARLHQYGYTYRFEVYVGDIVIYFEKDEEGGYRALTDAPQLQNQVDPELMQAIADSIENVLK
jgi:hypothetical protein